MLVARVYRLIFACGEVRGRTETVKKMTLRSLPTNDLSNAILSKKEKKNSKNSYDVKTLTVSFKSRSQKTSFGKKENERWKT